MIDFHTHFGKLWRIGEKGRQNLDAEGLLSVMDEKGISLAVLLPLESPDWGGGYLLTEEVIEARDRYPDRFIAFACADPRYPKAAEFIKRCVRDFHCAGFGEYVNGLALDDPLNLRLYEVCNDLGIPLVFEIARPSLCYDEPGLPRLEKCLKRFPKIQWCGHGPHFWTAISADDGEATGPYPKGRVKEGGAIDRLMSRYDNLWLDLSGMSGYNAMTRDPDFTAGFVQRHWRRMLLGTDITSKQNTLPILDWLAHLPVNATVRDALACGNARRLLRLA